MTAVISDPPDPRTGALQIASDVFVFRSEAFAMNCGVVLGSRLSLLVDPAFFPADLERIAAFASGADAEPGWIVLTHSDWDHIVGPVRWPRARVVASSEFPGRAAAEADRITGGLEALDRKLYVQRSQPLAIPEPGTLVGSPSDLVWPGRPLHLFPAGGHTRDGLMLLLRDERILFAGDHLSDREIPFVGDSIAAYNETLAHIRALAGRGEVDTLVPGHGDVCGRQSILERIDEDMDYLVRLDTWVRETRRTVDTLGGILERRDEVVFRKGRGNPDIEAEHRANVAGLARELGMS